MAKTGTSTVKQRAQIGFEADSAPGVAVAATFKPRSGKFSVSPNSERKEIAPSGELFPASVFELDRWAEGTVADATPCYRELAYTLRMITGRPVITQGSTPESFERIFTFDGENIPTMTVEYGDSDSAGRGLGVFVSGYSFEWSRNGRTSSYEVTLRGRDFEDGIALTSESAVTQLKLVPTSGQHIHVFLGNSVSEVRAASETEGVLSVKLNGGEPAGMVKYFSGTDLVSLFATSTLDLVMRKVEGLALINALRAGGQKYIRVALTYGPFVLEFISAVGLATEGTREDESGAYVVKPSLRLFKADNLSPTFRLVNNLPAYPGEVLTAPVPAPGTGTGTGTGTSGS